MAKLLDLSTLVERDFVLINGEQYELKNEDEFGIVELQALSSKYKRAAALERFDKLTPEQAADCSAALGEIVSVLLPGIEDDTLSQLSDVQRGMIVRAWRGDVDADPREPQTRTGAKPSRGSKPSTGESKDAG